MKERKNSGGEKTGQRIHNFFFTTVGFIVSVYDFWQLQHLHIQLILVISGIILLIVGFALRYGCRITLMKKAKFDVVSSFKLVIVDGQHLITDGIYHYIRHPLYLGEMIRNLGYAIVFSSLYGLILVIIANIFLLFRIEIEEKMLIDAFGKEYVEYQKQTKKLVPYVY